MLSFFSPDTVYSLSMKKRRRWAQLLFKKWGKNNAPFFDHRIDELRWPENIFWVERGILPRLYMKRGARVLDLCCGDGYFSDHFWSQTASHIDAVDRHAAALSLAMGEHAKPNISYYGKDIVHDPFPGTSYDIVCFFEAIEHLSTEDGLFVLKKIRDVLAQDGKLIGSTTIVRPEERGKGNHEHDNEFEDSSQLRDFLVKVFSDVNVFETFHPNRITAYYVCGSTCE